MPSATTYYQTNLDTDITYLKGVGPQRGRALKKYGIENVGQLFYHFPRRYLDRTTIKYIRETKLGEEAVIIGRVESFGMKQARKRRYFQMLLNDPTGHLTCVWFNSISWITDKFKIGDSVAVFGKLEFHNGFQIIHPEFDILEEGEDPVNTGKILSQYSSTADLKSVGLDSRGFRKIIHTALNQMGNEIKDYYTSDFRREEGLCTLRKALEQIHGPENDRALKVATYRLKYDEHFFLQLLMALKKRAREDNIGRIFSKREKYEKDIFNNLDFTLTDDQIQVLKEIRNDLASDKPMNRLIQGDVGSGKTIVALLSSLNVIESGYQVAFMSPTEILANQHYNLAKKIFPNEINIDLLTGKTESVSKKIIISNLKNSSTKMVFGTHSLFQKKTLFKKLGYIIIDEQHKFGVKQRKSLSDKGGSNCDILLMSATPIPRTLTMTIYGDMDLSVINEKPKNRKEIITYSKREDNIKDILTFVKKEIDKGNQIFWVCPLIDDSKKIDHQSAIKKFNSLNKLFHSRVAIIHSKIDNDKKNIILKGFLNKKFDILVSTTIIEVGIDFPNANVIIIENSNKFGLSQLHQLRGRVGRGVNQGKCILMFKNNLSENAKKRIKILKNTNNGFVISNEDMKLRGFGDVLGFKQSGDKKFNLADPIIHEDLFKIAEKEIRRIEIEETNLSKYKTLIKLYDKADIIYDLV